MNVLSSYVAPYSTKTYPNDLSVRPTTGYRQNKEDEMVSVNARITVSGQQQQQQQSKLTILVE